MHSITKLIVESGIPADASDEALMQISPAVIDKEIMSLEGVLPQEAMTRFKTLRTQYMMLGQKDVGQVFEYGSIVEQIHDLAPTQKTFETLLSKGLGLSRRGAENYRSVHRKLHLKRKRLEALKVKSSSLYVLSSGSPEQIDTIILRLENGEKLSLSAIKKALGQKTVSDERKANSGGLSGLRKACEERNALAVKRLQDRLFHILKDCHVALAPAQSGRRVEKGAAQAALKVSTRLAQAELEALLWVPSHDTRVTVGTAIRMNPFEDIGPWRDLHDVITQLSTDTMWPEATKLAQWFRETIIPPLEWAVGDRAEKIKPAEIEVGKIPQQKKTKFRTPFAPKLATQQKAATQGETRDKKKTISVFVSSTEKQKAFADKMANVFAKMNAANSLSR